MSLNCPHAWEEYKKLDLAYDDLRREYLALRDEQMDFSNVPKEWLVKMRELRGRCFGLKDVFHNIEQKYNFITLKRAEKIMGAQFYGPEEIENAFGFAVDKDKIPAIPYSPAELKKAKELGERLVLRTSEDGEGNAMTMEHLCKLVQSRISKDDPELLYDIDYYDEEEFYKKKSLETEWKLVQGNCLLGSTDVTYAEQTKILRNYLKWIGSLTASEEAECSDANLAKIANDPEKLAALEINQKHRRTPGEVLYDSFLHFKKFKRQDYFTETYDWLNYDWTNVVVCSHNVGFGLGFGKQNISCWINSHEPYWKLGVVSVR